MGNLDILRIVNLYGAPGVGKSAVRSGVFWLLKTMQESVEEISEFAKYLVLSGQEHQLREDQLFVVAHQHHKQMILLGKYAFAVTDSPLMLASFYAPKDTPISFHDTCIAYAKRFDNLNIFLNREICSSEFEVEGRIHSHEDSTRIQHEQKEFLCKTGETWIDLDIKHDTAWDIVEIMAQRWPDQFNGKMWPERPTKLVPFTVNR